MRAITNIQEKAEHPPIISVLRFVGVFVIAIPVGTAILFTMRALMAVPVLYLDRIAHTHPSTWGVVIGVTCGAILYFGAIKSRKGDTYEKQRERRSIRNI